MTDVGNIATIMRAAVADVDIGEDNARARCSRRAWSTEPAAECNLSQMRSKPNDRVNGKVPQA
jgi:hypothetical protein